MPAAAPTARISRPAGPAGRSAIPVTMEQSPTKARVSVITQRSAAPTAASTLIVSATGSTGRGCSRAAAVHPPTSSTGAAADETRPHQGTLRTIRTVSTGARRG
jgi:hypothetical protein